MGLYFPIRICAHATENPPVLRSFVVQFVFLGGSNGFLCALCVSAPLHVGFQPDFAPAYNPEFTPITIEQQTVTGEVATFNPMVYFGAAQAIFFMMFTAQGGATSLLAKRRDGTLQWMLVSPTPRMVILLGKLVGTLINCIVQLLLLFIFLSRSSAACSAVNSN